MIYSQDPVRIRVDYIRQQPTLRILRYRALRAHSCATWYVLLDDDLGAFLHVRSHKLSLATSGQACVDAFQRCNSIQPTRSQRHALAENHSVLPVLPARLWRPHRVCVALPHEEHADESRTSLTLTLILALAHIPPSTSLTPSPSHLIPYPRTLSHAQPHAHGPKTKSQHQTQCIW